MVKWRALEFLTSAPNIRWLMSGGLCTLVGIGHRFPYGTIFQDIISVRCHVFKAQLI